MFSITKSGEYEVAGT